MKTVTHAKLLEIAKTVKVLVAVHTGYQTIKSDWAPAKHGYIFENETLDGRVRWYKEVAPDFVNL